MKTKINILFYFLIIMTLSGIILNSCTEDDSDMDIDLILGKSYQGGIIFYLDGSGTHGLIAASTDQSTTAPWWNGSFITTGATSTSDGSTNTSAIILAQGNNGSYSAKLCRDYTGGGFNDWFLPSKNQLGLLYEQKILVGGFSNSIYWSSSESELATVWVQDFENGVQHLDNTSDEANVHTRAIRAF